LQLKQVEHILSLRTKKWKELQKMREIKDRLVDSSGEGLSLYSLIQSTYGSLSATEKRIADFVLNSPERIIYNTVTLVAEELEVAQSTVTRFCHSIGLRGFQELKIRLAQDLERSNPVEDTNQEMSLPKKFAQISANSVLDAATTIDYESLEQANELIAKANRILIYGVGESGAIAQLFKIKLMGLGLSVDSQVDVHLQSITAAHLTMDDVAIGISQQGSTRDIVNILGTARKSGAKTICITGQGKSPITEVSDLQLVCVNRSTSNIVDSFQSKSSIIYIIELLTIMLTLKLNNRSLKTTQNLSKTTESVLDKLY
jgi:RpiR family transcriptional regulator, carbohydrate utilization regulator